MSTHHVVAIDGPAASGKSSVSRKVAEKLGYAFVSSGLMYRAFTWVVCEAGLDPEADPDAVVALLDKTKIEASRRDNELFLLVNGSDPGDALTSDYVNGNVSKVAKIPDVRKALVRQQRACAEAADIVMEGRDIGSVVFPDTPYKFYLDASEEVRARRRADQGLGDEIAERDRLDSTRKVSPLKVADGATKIDTSDLTLPQVVEALLGQLSEQGVTPSST
ncbi:MAG: (d)CMP kinase [Verrucomicrobiales bacterium]|nr:(d)CMP kinase [Verrucomicrobiales bacterium]